MDAARPLPLHAARTSTARRAARALRQYTDSVGATAVDKSQYNPAVTLHAQALTSSQLRCGVCGVSGRRGPPGVLHAPNDFEGKQRDHAHCARTYPCGQVHTVHD